MVERSEGAAIMIKNIIIIVLSCLLYINWQRKLTYFSMVGALGYLLIKNGINFNSEDPEMLELQKKAIRKTIDFKTFFL